MGQFIRFAGNADPSARPSAVMPGRGPILVQPGNDARVVGQVRGGEVLAISRSVEVPELDSIAGQIRIERLTYQNDHRTRTISTICSLLRAVRGKAQTDTLNSYKGLADCMTPKKNRLLQTDRGTVKR
jgi:hypothetical protein